MDDAKRSVVLPASVGRVFAAGAPAEVLLYTLVPEKLAGRNRLPEGDAVEFFPPAFRNPVFIRQLPEVDNPAADAELVALKPDVYVDYGTVQEDYIASLEAVQKRTGVPGIILDGGLSRIPAVYRRLGAALSVGARGDQLADAAERLLTKYRGALSAPVPVRVYLACSADGLQPCLADQTAGEQLAWLGGVNVAGSRASAPRRPLTIDEVKALSPQVVVIERPSRRRRAAAGESRVAVGRGGCSRTGVRVAGPSIQLGRAAAVGQPPAGSRVARLRGRRACVSTRRLPATSGPSTATSIISS